MVGKQHGSNAVGGPIFGTRDKYRPWEVVEVSPHGACDLKAYFSQLAAATPQLVLYHSPDTHPGEETESKILSVNPWTGSRQMPTGYYPGATGTTRVWVLYWHLRPGFWESLLGEVARDRYQGHLEVSCLTWYYKEMGDYATSLVIEIHRAFEQSSAKPPFFERHQKVARDLAARVLQFLKATPADPESYRKREQWQRQEEERRVQEAADREQARKEKARQELQKAMEREKAIHECYEREKAEQERLERLRAERLAQKKKEREERERAERERKEALAREARRRAEERAARQVAVLYDSSYLMGNGDFLHRACSPLWECTVSNIVAEEVVEEIQNHLDSTDETKRAQAGRGRGRIVALMEESPFAYRTLQRVRLRDRVAPTHYDDLLEPDSKTDSLLINYGIMLLRTGGYLAVAIATHDSGIRYFVHKWRETEQLPLFSISNPEDYNQVQPLTLSLGLGRGTP